MKRKLLDRDKKLKSWLKGRENAKKDFLTLLKRVV